MDEQQELFVNRHEAVKRAGSGRSDRKFWFLSEALPG
jgi:hypothetical protein